MWEEIKDKPEYLDAAERFFSKSFRILKRYNKLYVWKETDG